MAKAQTPSKPEIRYVRHANRPEWGVGVLVSEDGDRATYLFADGQKRALKLDLAGSLLLPADPPNEENKARLERGLATGGIATPKAINLELEARILEAPDDPDAWIVYADWLQQQNDPRGQLIAIQTQLVDNPTSTKLRSAEKKLFDTQGEYLLPASFWSVLKLPKQKPDNPRTRSDITWRYGFIEKARLSKRPRQQADFVEIITELCRHPSARFLRGLTIGELGTTTRYSYAPMIDAIVTSRHPTLANVFIGDFDDDSTDFDSSRAGNLSGLLRELPQLTSLTVRAGTARFEAQLKHPKLAHLHLKMSALARGMLDRLTQKTDLPALERIELDCATLYAPHTDIIAELKRAFGPRVEVEVRGSTQSIAQDPDRRAALLAAADVLITETEISARAADNQTMEAARPIARPNAWQTLSRDGDRLWGDHPGSSGTYGVVASLSDDEGSCSCPSTKDPCKHIIALLLLAANGATFASSPLPERLVRQLERPRRRYFRSTYE